MKSEALVFFDRGETAITKVKYGRGKNEMPKQRTSYVSAKKAGPLVLYFQPFRGLRGARLEIEMPGIAMESKL